MHVIYITLCSFLQRMRQEFRTVLNRTVMVASADDKPKPSTSTSTEPHDTSLPRVLRTHCQHSADYVRLMMEDIENLTMGEDQAAPLITEVFSPVSFHTSIFKFTLNSSCSLAQFITLFSFRPYKRSV